MARSRTPRAKAETAGRTLHDPGRYRDRHTPKGMRPIGEPYPSMTEPQRELWAEFAANLPWLNAAHRQLLRLACLLSARMETTDGMGIGAIGALSSILSKLGATPVDECRVGFAGEAEEDPADRFFH